MRIGLGTLLLLAMMPVAHAQSTVAPAAPARDRDPWVVGVCASDEERTVACYAKPRDKAVLELSAKVFQKAVDNYFKARPIRNFFDNPQESRRKDDELRRAINEAQASALPEIESKLVRTIASIKPAEGGAEAMREQVDGLVMRMALEAGPAIEKAAEKSPHHKPVSSKAMPKR